MPDIRRFLSAASWSLPYGKQQCHQLCSATSLLLFDALSMRKVDALSIPKQIRIEHPSVAFLDCVEDGGACLLMSVGRGALLLWFFEVASEPQITPSKAKNASTKPTLSSASSKRYVSIENSPEMEAREGLEGYYSDLEDEQALDRIRSRINPEGLNEDELLQLALQASLADASDRGDATQRHLLS